MSDQIAEEAWEEVFACASIDGSAHGTYYLADAQAIQDAVRAEIRESEARMMERIAALEGRKEPRKMKHPRSSTVHDECPDCRGVCDPVEQPTPDALPEGAVGWAQELLDACGKIRDAKDAVQILCKLQAKVVERQVGYDVPSDCFCGEGGFGPRHQTAEAGYRHSGESIAYIIRATEAALTGESEITRLRAELAESRPRRVTQEGWVAMCRANGFTSNPTPETVPHFAGVLRAAGLLLPGDTPEPRAETISREELERLFGLFITELGENGYSGDIKNALAAVLRELGKEVEV